MARKTEKDLKLEALEAKLANIEEAKDTKKRWVAIPERWRILIIAVVIICLFCIAMYFYVEIRNATAIKAISESEYQRILMIVDNTKWQISKSSFRNLQDNVSSKVNGQAYIDVEDDLIDITIFSEDYDSWIRCVFDDGFIKGFLEGQNIKVFFSESLVHSGRSLTLYIAGEKLVFYQEL